MNCFFFNFQVSQHCGRQTCSLVCQTGPRSPNRSVTPTRKRSRRRRRRRRRRWSLRLASSSSQHSVEAGLANPRPLGPDTAYLPRTHTLPTHKHKISQKTNTNIHTLTTKTFYHTSLVCYFWAHTYRRSKILVHSCTNSPMGLSPEPHFPDVFLLYFTTPKRNTQK